MYRTIHRWRGSRGVTIVLMVVFLGVFSIIASALVGYVFTQANFGRAKHAREEALSLAEAGLEYYRWFLAHNPNDLTDGTGLPGPYEHTIYDPEGGEVGTFELTISGNSACGIISAIDISSTGISNRNPQFTRTLTVRYAQPSVAEYSYVLNSNVWAGATRDITGPYHSNGGIRMDGNNNSDVTSAVDDWLCTSSFGCSPSQTQDGVFGGGAGSALWQNPVPQFDFEGIAADFNTLRGYAQADGIFLPTVSGGDQRGYHIILNADNTVDVYRVTGTSYVWGVHADDTSTWQRDYHIIDSETFVGSYPIPSDCPVIYSESKVWLEGTVATKLLLAAATSSADTPDIILNGNIDYTATDGSVGLTAIAERSVLIPLLSPDNMLIRGIFIAQDGYYGRNYYTTSGSYDVPSAYNAYVTRDTLTAHGTFVSNGRTGTSWSCGGTFCSGYANRVDAYDRLLAFDPPPFTPYAAADFSFVQWREE